MTGVQTCALPICFPVTISADKEVEIPKYFEIEDDKFGKIVFGEESFQGGMMAAEKQILEGTAAIKTLESIYADKNYQQKLRR